MKEWYCADRKVRGNEVEAKNMQDGKIADVYAN